MEITASVAAKVQITASATVSQRTNFAIQHLRAAVRAARDAYQVEQANLAAEHGPWFDEMMTLVPVSVVMAWAALEANVNEIIQDILDGFTELPLTKARELLLKDLKEGRSGNATDKYRKLTLLFDKEPITGEVAWQDANLLTKFRNRLMHFKPAWDDEQAQHDGLLVKSLKTKISVYRAYQDGFLFPHGFMTYSCTTWSVLSVLTFSESFSALLGVNDRFVAPYLDFSLPPT